MFIIGPFLVVGWFSAYIAADSMKEEVGKTMLQLVRQNHITLEKSLSSMNDRTITFLDDQFFSNPDRYNFWTQMETLSDIQAADSILERWSTEGTEYNLYMIHEGNKQIPSALLFKTHGFFFVNESNLPEWAGHALSKKGRGILRLNTTDDGMSTVHFARSITNPKNYAETIGFLVVSNLEVVLTRDLVSVQLPENAGIYLFNEQNECLMKVGPDEVQLQKIPEEAQVQQAGYYFAREDGKSWLYAYSHRPAFNTSLVYKIPLDSIIGNQAVIQWIIMFASFVYLLFVLFFVLYLLRIVVKPLAQLVSITKIYEPGKPLDVSDELLRSDEFGILYGAFLKMTRRLDQMIEENYVMTIRQKEIELATLHSQITPHLLYNTLDSIYWYSLDSGNKDVADMVKDLSKLLRIGLSKGKTVITIGEELEHVRAYTRLQMRRYPDAFEVFWDIGESVLDCVTPKVILQPLVENAIFHGVSSMDGEGQIWIRVRKSGGEVLMMVEDNGFMPLDMDRLQAILTGEANDKGYGIRNVHQRIQLHFGEAYGLRYERREGGGLRAVINLPYRESDASSKK